MFGASESSHFVHMSLVKLCVTAVLVWHHWAPTSSFSESWFSQNHISVYVPAASVCYLQLWWVAAEAKRKAEAEAKAKAEQEAKLKADQAAEAKQKADAEAKQKAEADKQAEADQKAAAEQAAKAEAAKEAEAQAAAAQKQKDDDAKASKSKAEEAPASPSKDPASALSTSSASSLSAKQKRKDMMKRAEEKDTAAGYEDPFQPKQAAAAQSSAPAAGPQPVKTQAESSGRYAFLYTQLPHETCAAAMQHQPVTCIRYLP